MNETKQQIEVRGVLAGAYKGKAAVSRLTHGYVADEAKTLCGRVPAEHLSDIFADVGNVITCQRCAAKAGVRMARFYSARTAGASVISIETAQRLLHRAAYLRGVGCPYGRRCARCSK